MYSSRKIKAVEDYMNGLRSVSEIMRDLSIKSSRSIRDWIGVYQQHGEIALLPTTKNSNYSSDFKIMVVEKYLNGEVAITDLCALYKILFAKRTSIFTASRTKKHVKCHKRKRIGILPTIN